MQSTIRPNTYIALRLPSEFTKILQIAPNTVISLGKFGSFPANQILGRPFYVTYEILDERQEDGHVLRMVSAAELHTEALIADGSTPGEPEAEPEPDDGDSDERPTGVNGDNRHTVDDASTQRMTMDEIEALKQGTTGAGQEVITRIMQSHAALDQKTAFSRAKYMVRKQRKFLRRFSVLPVDVPLLTNWMLEEKDAGRVMELRDEMLGLVGCWANVHYREDLGQPSGRWLVVDDTGGLMVAAMAERMGVLHPDDNTDEVDEVDEGKELATDADVDGEPDWEKSRGRIPGMSATNSTLTVVHPNLQPNLTLLKYFGYDTNSGPETHPLHRHLKTISWLQLVEPQSDSFYSREPAPVDETTLASWKGGKRGAHFRKQRRWARVRRVVDETRAGGFDGLMVASQVDPASILKHTVPLLSGSAPVVVYSPNIEPLVELADLYSTARRTAWINRRREDGIEETDETEFPVDPTQLLATMVQTSRVRGWQVLPGRTHPSMTEKGGAEGYVFHATKVMPATGPVEARGQPGRKKRKVDPSEQQQQQQEQQEQEPE